MPANIIREGPRLLPVADAVLVTDVVAQFVALSMPLTTRAKMHWQLYFFYSNPNQYFLFIIYYINVINIIYFFVPLLQVCIFKIFFTTPRTKTDNLKLYWGFSEVTLSGSNSSKNPPLCISFLTGLL